jgi:thiamine-monophosphate kinase
MRIDELGEFALIARLTAGLPTRADVALGAGDDAALLDLGDFPADSLLVATCDAQVEGAHFTLGAATPEEIGHKALAVNLSDLAAMGAEPLWALVSLALPRALDVSVLDGVYAGLRLLATRCSVALVGGNVAATDGPLTLDVTALGRVPRGRALTRAGGRPGDILLVTGTLGAAAAGVLLYGGGARLDGISADIRRRAHAAQASPEPRLAEGLALAASGVVTAMLDVSDGLAADVGHLCDASHVSAELDASAIPVDPAVVAVAAALGLDALRLALEGGEDYELVFAVRPAAAQQALEAVTRAGGAARVIGRLTEPGPDLRSGLRLRHAGGRMEHLEARGWDHLRPRQ